MNQQDSWVVITRSVSRVYYNDETLAGSDMQLLSLLATQIHTLESATTLPNYIVTNSVYVIMPLVWSNCPTKKVAVFLLLLMLDMKTLRSFIV